MKPRRLARALLPLVLAAAGQASADESCAPLDKAGVAALFDRWNLALATNDPDAVAQRYWNDAVLLPTVSNTPRTSPAMVRDYFVHFLEKHPRGRIDSRSVQLGCNLAIDMGTYTFAVMNESGTPADVVARYTFVYAFRDGEWKILHHHSSAMPEVMVAASAGPAGAAAVAATHGEKDSGGPAQGAKVSGTKAERDRQRERELAVSRDATRMFLNSEASPSPMEFYPAEARAKHEAGRVALRVCADPEGKVVGEPRVLKSSGSDRLDVAARRWAQSAKWVPATSNRRSVEGCAEVTAQFRP